jgi:hypothetical protein
VGRVLKLAHNVLQLNADFVLHKICDLGAVIAPEGLELKI